jgi:septum formation protein
MSFDFIYLASSSQSRQELLKISNIPFQVVAQNANEDQFDRSIGLEQVVCQIANEKMRCAILPNGKFAGEICYVVAADTMGVSQTGEIFGKPKDREHAIYMLKSFRAGAQTGTAFCLQKRIWVAGCDQAVSTGSWQVVDSVTRYVSANYVFNVPDQMLDLYFKYSMQRFGISYLDVSGAVAIEDYGLQFATNFTGSFTTVMGLPLYELRTELLNFGFKFS